ncbi:hypothetical protein [Pseudomonas guariconensis]|uniref:hypothetical protein n=1 Tax=Pseudomonas guariconensis TaxID=1288410 RepID=UPI003905B9F8
MLLQNIQEPTLIGPAAVERDADGWWKHPDLPTFNEDIVQFSGWLQTQRLELVHWSMECDGPEDHPYWDGMGGYPHCRGWYPNAPGPEWFLLSILDTEHGPRVSWVRRVPTDRWEALICQMQAQVRSLYASACDHGGTYERVVHKAFCHSMIEHFGVDETRIDAVIAYAFAREAYGYQTSDELELDDMAAEGEGICSHGLDFWTCPRGCFE